MSKVSTALAVTVPPMHALGQHLLLELYDCDAELLNQPEFIEQQMLQAARQAKATIVSSSCHHFNPFGVSGVVVIAESHITIHTWPEHKYAAVDIFTCGDTICPDKIGQHMSLSLAAARSASQLIQRGQFPHPVDFKPNQ